MIISARLQTVDPDGLTNLLFLIEKFQVQDAFAKLIFIEFVL